VKDTKTGGTFLIHPHYDLIRRDKACLVLTYSLDQSPVSIPPPVETRCSRFRCSRLRFHCTDAMFASPMIQKRRQHGVSTIRGLFAVETRCSRLRCSRLRFYCRDAMFASPMIQKRRMQCVSTIRGLFAGRDAMFASLRFGDSPHEKRVNLSIHPKPSVRAFCKRPRLFHRNLLYHGLPARQNLRHIDPPRQRSNRRR